ASGSESSIATDLRDAALSPLAATGLGMIVEANSPDSTDRKSAPEASGGVRLRIAIDPKQLLLREGGGRREGAVDMLFVQRDAAGKILPADKQHLDLKLPEAQYESLSHTGMVLQRHVTLNGQVSQLTIVVRDVASGALGSLDIPAAALAQA